MSGQQYFFECKWKRALKKWKTNVDKKSVEIYGNAGNCFYYVHHQKVSITAQFVYVVKEWQNKHFSA